MAMDEGGKKKKGKTARKRGEGEERTYHISEMPLQAVHSKISTQNGRREEKGAKETMKRKVGKEMNVKEKERREREGDKGCKVRGQQLSCPLLPGTRGRK